MPIKLGLVMDPIAEIYTPIDGSLAMLFEAQQRGWQIYYMEIGDLFYRDGFACGCMRELSVQLSDTDWYNFLGEKENRSLEELDVILMRKDPPFDMEYVYATYLLELAEKQGCLVINRPSGLRDANEKMFTTWFPQCCPPTLVTRNAELLLDFIAEHKDVVVKPLNFAGGCSVFHLKLGDHNINVAIEMLTQKGTAFAMAQKFIPDVLVSGDKRIILVEGKPMPYGYARVPAAGDFRGNIAADAVGKGVALNEHDYWICEQIGTVLREKGLLFVGIDVIGNYLTEINVTSPTHFRQLEAEFGINIVSDFFDCIERRL
jgi:glutathione synthase